MDEAAGTAFGQYELVSRIGRGGMGETWKARRRDVANAPFVVIKRILPQFADDPMFVESFVNEAHVTASLTHPNIAHVLDFGQVDGEYFFVIEYVHGRTIEGLIHAAAQKGFRTLPLPVACYLTLELLEGLQYAHTMKSPAGRDLRVVHRDISPDNVLIGFDGQVKVVDFGVAQARMTGREETEAGIVKGKWPYFSPEQARAEELDGRSDLFAVGVTLYRMVCGRLPFQGTQLVAVHKMLKADYPPPQLVNPSMPTVLADCIARALEMKKEKRFQAAENMQTALRTVLKATAPQFDQAELRAFVHWCFEGELPGEGVRSQVPATFRGTFESWQARAAMQQPAGVAPDAPLRTSMRKTAMTFAGSDTPPPRKRNWLAWMGASSFLLGVAAVAWLALPRQVAAPNDPNEARRGKYAQATALMSAIEANVPGRSDGFRDRYIALGLLVDDPGTVDEAFAVSFGQLEGELNQALRQARLDAEVAASQQDAGTSSREPPPSSPPRATVRVLEEFAFGSADSRRITLSFERHNLTELPSEPLPVELGKGLTLVVGAVPGLNEPPKSLLVFAQELRRSGAPPSTRIFLINAPSPVQSPATLRIFDFRQTMSWTPTRASLSWSGNGPSGAKVINPTRVSGEAGGHARLTGLRDLGNLRIRVVKAKTNATHALVASCDGEVRLVSTTVDFIAPSDCALALVAQAGSTGSVEVELGTTRPVFPDLPPRTALTAQRARAFRSVPSVDRDDRQINATLEAGKKLYQARRYADARAQFRRCLALSGLDQDCRLHLAMAESRLGNRDAALSIYRRFLRENETDESLEAVRAIVDGAAGGKRRTGSAPF